MKMPKYARRWGFLVLFLIMGLVAVPSVYGKDKDTPLSDGPSKIVFSTSESSTEKNNLYLLEKSEILGVMADTTAQIGYKLKDGYTFSGYSVNKERLDNGEEILVIRLYKQKSTENNTQDNVEGVTIDLSNVQQETQIRFITQ